MNIKELINRVSYKTNFHAEDVEIVCKALIQEIMKNNQKQKNITIEGFGTFKINYVKSFVRTRKATNKKHTVSGYKYVRFVPHKQFKKQFHNEDDHKIIINHIKKNDFIDN